MGIGFVYKAAIALAVILAIIMVPMAADESDAATEYSAEITVPLDVEVTYDLHDYIDGKSYSYINNTKYSSDSRLPTGLSRDGFIISGTATTMGQFNTSYMFHDSFISLGPDAYLYITWIVLDIDVTYNVTYDAGIGKVNGSKTWSEQIVEGTYASLPEAVYTSGAYTFKGWSLGPTSSSTIGSLIVEKDVTLYAVWERNTVTVSPLTATISRDQTSEMPVDTDPSDAVVSIDGYGGLPDYAVILDDHTVYLDMTDVEPGAYMVTLAASKTGYYTGYAVLQVNVPIAIVKPIEYTLASGDQFFYTPVTNPTNANIELTSVRIDESYRSDLAGLRVEGRTITGTLTEPGTYIISYRASLSGYVEVTGTVIVYVHESGTVSDPVSLASVASSARALEPRVYDFIALGGSNVSNYVWSVDGVVFATSSSTALYEFPSAGVYVVTCTAYGFSGDSVSMDVTVVCSDSYHREAAWAGVEYGYIVKGSHQVSLQSGAPFDHRTVDMDGTLYTIVSGTPSQSQIGSSYRITVGPESWTVKVYGAESSAPTAAFDIRVTDRTVDVAFTGSNASFYGFDFDGDGEYDDGTSWTYDEPGRYVISCRAVNNISEVVSRGYAEVDVAHEETTTIEHLTDFEMAVDEKLYVTIMVAEGETLAVTGTAARFVTVDGNVLTFQPGEAGVFSLTVVLFHTDGTADRKTVKVTVKDDDPVPSESGDYAMVIAALFGVSVAIVSVLLLMDSRTGSKVLRRKPSRPWDHEHNGRARR